MGTNGYNPANPPDNPDDGGLDPKVAATLLRWGNFDYQTNATRWEATEIPSEVSVPTTRTLPATPSRSSRRSRARPFPTAHPCRRARGRGQVRGSRARAPRR